MEIFNYLSHICIIFFIFSFFSLAACVSVGLTGMFNLSFPGIGLCSAYISALSAIHVPLPFELCFVVSCLFGGLIGLGLSAVSNRFKGDYYALVTFGFNYVALTIALNWESVTNGALGLNNIPFESFILDTDNHGAVFLMFGFLFAVAVLVLVKLKFSPLGRTLMAIREDELACLSTGRNTFKFKNMSSFVAGVLSGGAGSLYAHYISYMDPFSIGMHDLVLVLTAIFLGGLHSLRGVLIGTLILTLIPEILRFFAIPAAILGPTRQIIYSLILLTIIWFRPSGIFSEKT
ncbi:MAG: branched-chain amino acid ABC transporter permease [Deltaproteobacteria bacterium]|nr:branched-chain amino acid ABC transporter permease [Deltaproteobacteria bacterium]